MVNVKNLLMMLNLTVLWINHLALAQCMIQTLIHNIYQVEIM